MQENLFSGGGVALLSGPEWYSALTSTPPPLVVPPQEQLGLSRLRRPFKFSRPSGFVTDRQFIFQNNSKLSTVVDS